MLRRRRYLLLLVAVLASLVVSQDNEPPPAEGTPLSITPLDSNPTSDTLSAASNEDTCQSPLSASNLQSNLVNGTHLSLLVALPLTFKKQPVLSPGFFQLASALMAIDHFNERNSIVVPEIEGIKDCTIHIDYESLVIMDTGTVENNGLSTIIDSLRDRQVPNAIIGPYNEIPATELSVVASSLNIPMVTHRALDHNLLLPGKHPMVTQLNPDLYSEMDFLGDYLNHTGRTDYIAVLYASSSDSAIQRLEAFRGVANSLEMKNVKAFGYVSPATPVDSRPVQTIEDAVAKVAATGYRTIVWLTPHYDEDTPGVGRAAHEWQLDIGNHLWVNGASLELDKPTSQDQNDFINISTADGQEDLEELLMFFEILEKEGLSITDILEQMHPEMMGPEMTNDTAVDAFIDFQFLFNSAYLSQVELFDKASWNQSSFMNAWMQLNSSFLERIQGVNPIATDDYQHEWQQALFTSLILGYSAQDQFLSTTFPPEDLFSNPIEFLSAPTSGVLNLYDAIMSVGLGACRAATKTTAAQPNITGEILQAEIRKVRFQGSNGEVWFGDGFPGSRAASTVSFGVYNLFPDGTFRKPFLFTEYRNATDGEWYKVEPFIYADGTRDPPELLRDPADQNYLSDGVRVAGLILAGIAFFITIASALWIIAYRHHSVVIASQPIFLVAMCSGSLMETACIVLLSFDESHGWSVEALTGICIAVPWLVIFGHIITYNMLFTKLWRVNRVLQFSRRKVQMKHVIWPALLLESVVFIILSVWTSKTDYGWERAYIDEATGESIAKCADGMDELQFWIPIALLAMIPTLLTGIMAWKTIDVDAAYSEAKWIFALMLVHFQVFLVAMPLIVILEDVSTDGRYLGAVMILWTFPTTTMGLIMFPKMVAVHFPKKGSEDRRGSSIGVRVTGVSSSTARRSSGQSQSLPTHPHVTVIQQ